ncbi:MAG: hypothetical protein M1820_000096 [Bogoriella megaspora]|nr:MAG: hypothetical protein M1820_000096 [Bogoriella megaspora]
MAPSANSNRAGKSALERLPAELKHEIFSHVLPRTISAQESMSTPRHDLEFQEMWTIGEVALLVVSRNISEAALDFIYSCQVFRMKPGPDTGYPVLEFQKGRFDPKNAMKTKFFQLPLFRIAPINLGRIRRLTLFIYFGQPSNGFIKSIRLGPTVREIRELPNISSFRLRLCVSDLWDPEQYFADEYYRLYLEPLRALKVRTVRIQTEKRSVRHDSRINISADNISPEEIDWLKDLEKDMTLPA